MTLWREYYEDSINLREPKSEGSAQVTIRFRPDSVDASAQPKHRLPDVREVRRIIDSFPPPLLRSFAVSLLRASLEALRDDNLSGLREVTAYWNTLASHERRRHTVQVGREEKIRALSAAYEREAIPWTEDDISEADLEILNHL